MDFPQAYELMRRLWLHFILSHTTIRSGSEREMPTMLASPPIFGKPDKRAISLMLPLVASLIRCAVVTLSYAMLCWSCQVSSRAGSIAWWLSGPLNRAVALKLPAIVNKTNGLTSIPLFNIPCSLLKMLQDTGNTGLVCLYVVLWNIGLLIMLEKEVRMRSWILCLEF